MLRERLLRCAELAGRVNEALDFDCAPHPRRSAFGSTASIQVWQPKVGSPPKAGAQPARHEPLLMPHSGRCSAATQRSPVGGNLSFSSAHPNGNRVPRADIGTNFLSASTGRECRVLRLAEPM
jgi:hypothetical protein